VLLIGAVTANEANFAAIQSRLIGVSSAETASPQIVGDEAVRAGIPLLTREPLLSHDTAAHARKGASAILSREQTK
jgi:hypothetical protein